MSLDEFFPYFVVGVGVLYWVNMKVLERFLRANSATDESDLQSSHFSLKSILARSPEHKQFLFWCGMAAALWIIQDLIV